MPGRVEEDENGEKRSSEEIDHQTNQILRLGLSALGHPKYECEHVHIRNNHTSEEAYSNVPRDSWVRSAKC